MLCPPARCLLADAPVGGRLTQALCSDSPSNLVLPCGVEIKWSCSPLEPTKWPDTRSRVIFVTSVRAVRLGDTKLWGQNKYNSGVKLI